MLPAQNVSEYVQARIEDATQKLVKELDITGPYNIQFIVKGSDVLVIECNLRASRSFPFISKTMGVDFIEGATKLVMDKSVDDMDLPPIGTRNRPSNFVGVKAPMFSFTRLGGADPVLGVEMASTGEVACFGDDVHEAFLKALVSTGFKIPQKKIALTVQPAFLEEVVHHIWLLHEMGYELYATQETYPFLLEKNIPAKLLHYADQKDKEPNMHSVIANGDVDLVINLRDQAGTGGDHQNYLSRRTAVDYGVPLLTNAQLFTMFSESLEKHKNGQMKFMQADSLFDYYAGESKSQAWTDPDEFH
jgi:carbamoyl-phosphate synthase (ammonia)